MTSPEAPTQVLRRATRPLEPLQRPQRSATAQEASCTRCGGRIEDLSQGHYGSTCLVTWTEEGFHFCCPGGCELQAS